MSILDRSRFGHPLTGKMKNRASKKMQQGRGWHPLSGGPKTHEHSLLVVIHGRVQRSGGILQSGVSGMGRAITSPAFDNPFQQLDPDEELWLNTWDHEAAKELAVEALRVCIDLVLPASNQPTLPSLSEGDLGDTLRRWCSVCYSGTTFKIAMDVNIQTAIEIHNRWRTAGSDGDLRPIADSFLSAARNQYNKLIADGMPDGLRPWRRFLEPPPPVAT
jgi:hypothetical protein